MTKDVCEVAMPAVCMGESFTGNWEVRRRVD